MIDTADDNAIYAENSITIAGKPVINGSIALKSASASIKCLMYDGVPISVFLPDDVIAAENEKDFKARSRLVTSSVDDSLFRMANEGYILKANGSGLSIDSAGNGEYTITGENVDVLGGSVVSAGLSVRINVPENAYDVIVTADGGENIITEKLSSTVYRFIMPSENVTVTYKINETLPTNEIKSVTIDGSEYTDGDVMPERGNVTAITAARADNDVSGTALYTAVYNGDCLLYTSRCV